MNQNIATLMPHRVKLYEVAGDKLVTVFDCQAEDTDHAQEQATNAYPGCQVASSLPNDGSLATYVIYSPNESATNPGHGFWSNEHRSWVEFDQATKFSDAERTQYNPDLTIALGGDDRWVPWEEANMHYGQSIAVA